MRKLCRFCAFQKEVIWNWKLDSAFLYLKCQVLNWKNYNMSDFELIKLQFVKFFSANRSSATIRVSRKRFLQQISFRLLLLRKSDRFWNFGGVSKKLFLVFEDDNVSELEWIILQPVGFCIEKVQNNQNLEKSLHSIDQLSAAFTP